MLRSMMRRTALIVTAGLLAMMPLQPVAAEEFEIIYLLKSEKKYDGPATLALVAGGYKNGLEEGMVGSLLRFTDTSYTAIPEYDLLVVEVQDVTAYESACLIRGANLENIESGTTVEFDIPELGAQEVRNRASDALAVKKYRRALHYFVELIRVDSLNADSSVQQLLAHCRQEIEQADSRKLTRKEKRAEKKRAAIYHKLGTYFFNHENYDAARWYFERVVRGDKKQEDAKYMLSLIEEAKHRLSLKEEVVSIDRRAHEELFPGEVFPEMVYQASPEYPRQAKQNGITGVVRVKALVDKSGSVLDVLIQKSSGTMLLDQAAVKAARKCRYKPGIQDGRPINCWVTYKVDFVLD